MNKAVDLFNFSQEEEKLTVTLQNIIKNEITVSGGVIPFSRYMELALYYPGLGYYSNPGFKFGAKGDFITAPLVSNLFGYTLARSLAELFELGVKRQLLEFGAGNGKLAADILRALANNLDVYYILELSADLVMTQRETIKTKVPEYANKVVWLTELPTNFSGIMLANEVLDAQPCNLVYYANKQIHGIGVSYNAGKFAYNQYTPDHETLTLAHELVLDYADYQTEIHLANRGFIRSLADSLKHGAIILIDYGYGEREYYHPQRRHGTLRGFFRQHLIEDVLSYPGLIDITSSVNWTAIATCAINAGLELIGYTSQANFLINCGILDDLLGLQGQLSAGEYLQLSNQVNRLISLNEMGDVFKVMGLSKGIAADCWQCFISGDRSSTL